MKANIWLGFVTCGGDYLIGADRRSRVKCRESRVKCRGSRVERRELNFACIFSIFLLRSTIRKEGVQLKIYGLDSGHSMHFYK